MIAVRRLLLCVGFAVLFGIPGRVFAVSAPSAIDIFVSQGDTQTVEIPVVNDAADQNRLSFSLVHVSIGADSQPILGSSASDVSWLSTSETNDMFEAGETRSLTVTAAPSTDISSGSYVFALLSTEQQEGSYVLTHGTATLLFVTIGSVQGDGRCMNFSHQDDGTFSLTLQNVGQGILYEEGKILLRGPFGIVWAATSSNPSKHRIFAGQTRAWNGGAIDIPWWALGPLEYSLESDLLSSTCPRISAGFGWVPMVGILFGAAGIFVIRRRK